MNLFKDFISSIITYYLSNFLFLYDDTRPKYNNLRVKIIQQIFFCVQSMYPVL